MRFPNALLLPIRLGDVVMKRDVLVHLLAALQSIT
jgi:hypothetical protein